MAAVTGRAAIAMSTSGSRACPRNSRSRPVPSLKSPPRHRGYPLAHTPEAGRAGPFRLCGGFVRRDAFPPGLGTAGPARPPAPAAGAAGGPPAGRGGRELSPCRQEPGLQQHDPAGRDPCLFPAGKPRTLPVTPADLRRLSMPRPDGAFFVPGLRRRGPVPGCMKICLLYNF